MTGVRDDRAAALVKAVSYNLVFRLIIRYKIVHDARVVIGLRRLSTIYLDRVPLFIYIMGPPMLVSARSVKVESSSWR
jgi:hypothetical protein